MGSILDPHSLCLFGFWLLLQSLFSNYSSGVACFINDEVVAHRSMLNSMVVSVLESLKLGLQFILELYIAGSLVVYLLAAWSAGLPGSFLFDAQVFIITSLVCASSWEMSFVLLRR